MLKKIICCLLSGILLLSVLSGCGKDSEKSGGASTGELERGEPITLTYASWEKDPMEKYMIEKFQEKYDWITVDSIQIDQNTWESGLMQLADTGDLPDVFWCFNLATATENGWTLDITDYYDNDEYNENIPNELKMVGVYDGKRYGTVVHQFPWVIFLNKTLFEQSNVQMPSYNWTYDEMINCAKQFSMPNQYYYGMNGTKYYFSDIFPIINSDNLMDLGFDPKNETFNWDTRIAGLNDAFSLINQKVIANLLPEEKEKAYGSADIWEPESGKIAMQLDYFWTGSYLQSIVFTSQNMEWVAYPLPSGTSNRQFSTVDCGAVSASTEHPREAYELLKFMNYGREGWLAKIEYFKQQSNPIPHHLPVAMKDETVISAVKELLPGEDWAAVLEAMKRTSPYVRYWLPGQSEFWSWAEEQEIYAKFDSNELKIEDIAPQIEEKLKEFYDESMKIIKARD